MTFSNDQHNSINNFGLQNGKRDIVQVTDQSSENDVQIILITVHT